MKKLIYTILAAAATLFAVSCARETEKAGLDNGDTVEAQFNLGFAGTLTKAYSDGLSATRLVVGVYDKQVGYLEGLSIAPDATDYKNAFAQLQTTYTARLVKGHGYDIVFLAVAPDNGVYSIDLPNGTFRVNPSGPSNEELRDAFYAVYSIDKVSAAIDQTVTLTRPFAQINVISEKQDFEAAEKAQVNFGKSALKINAPSVLNLVDGSVAEPVDYNLTPAAMPVENGARGAHPNFEPYQSRGDYWLMTDYVLVDPSGCDTEVNFTLYSQDSEEELFSYSIPNVALKQNYRTNIYGSVLTTDGHFTVVIEPEYFGEMEAPVDGVVPEITMYDSTLPADGGLLKVEVGKTINFKAIHPVESIIPEYSSSIEEVGTIDKNGLFTGVADGKTIVTIYFPAVWNGVPSDNPGVVPGSDPGTEPGSGSEPGNDPGTGTEPGTDPGTTPGTDPSGEKGTASNPYTVAEALAEVAKLADGAKSAEVYVKGVITDITEISTQYKNATYLIGDSANASEKLTVFRGKYLDGADFTAGDEIKATDNVVLCGQLQKYVKDNVTTPELVSSKIISLNGTTAPAGMPAVKGDAAAVNYAARVIQYTVIVGNGGGEGPSGEAGTKDNPYTVAEALSVINGLENGAKTENDVYVKGVITDIKELNTDQYGNATYSIADSESATAKLVVYRGYYLDGEKFTEADQIKVKDNVVVCGKLQKYVDKDDVMTPEVAQGSKLVSINGQGGNVEPEPPSGDGDYVKVTSAPSDWSGVYLIVYEDGGVAFNGGLTDKLDVAENGISVTISGGTIASSTDVDNATFTIAKMDGGYSVKSHSGKFISGKAETNTIVEGADAVANTISLSDGNAVIASNAASIMYNSTSGQLRFRFYKDGSNQKPVALYKKTSGGGSTPDPDQPVTATITASDVTVEVGKTVNIGATTNSTAAIQYSVADASIATVSNGSVTGVKAGSTTITLSVAAVEGKFTEASKTINVTVKEAGTQPSAQTVTIAQFIAAPDYAKGTHEELYQITGTITEIKNSTYGNFYLKDSTGEVYVYGLTKEKLDPTVKEDGTVSWTNDKSFASLGLKVGDELTMIAYKTTYTKDNTSTIEAVGGYYVSHKAGTTPGSDPGTGTDPVDGTAVTMTQEQLAAAACGNTTVTVDNVISFTNSSDYGSNTVTELRVYKNNILKITAKSGYSIKQIVITCSANGTTKWGPGCWGVGAPNGYTFDENGPTGTWTGSASTVEFTAIDNQVRIKEMKIVYKAN